MKTVLKSLLITLAAFCSVVILSMGFFVAKLSLGSTLNLAFLKTSLVERFIPLDHHLDFDKLTLIYDKEHHVLRLETQRLSYHHKEVSPQKATLQRGALTFPISGLWHLHVVPESIDLEGLQVTLNPLHSEKPTTVDINFDRLNGILEDLVDLKHITLSNSRLLFQTQTFLLHGRVEQTPQGLMGRFSLQRPDGPSTVESTITYDPPTQKVTLETHLNHFNSQDLGLFFSPELQKLMAIGDLTLEATYTYSLQTKTQQGNLSGTVTQLRLTNDKWWLAPLEIPEITFQGHLEGKTFTLQPIALTLPYNIPLSATLTGTIDDQQDRLTTHLQVHVGDIPFKFLGTLWPKGVADGAREWITENITGGLASDSTVMMKSHLDFSGNGQLFTLDHLSGSIRVNNAILGYVDTMPKITNLNALAAFDQDHFDITITSGTTQGLTLQKGKVIIGKFSDPVCFLSIEIPIKGKLQDMLTLIDHEPLMYAKAFGIDPQKSGGAATALLSMRFPLVSPFKTEAIETTVKATLNQVILKNLVDLPLDLTNGAFTVDVGLHDVTITGKALLNQEHATIQLKQNLTPAQLDLMVKTVVTPSSLKPLWESNGLFFDGKAPLTLLYQVSPKKQALTLKADLKQAGLNTLLMRKDQGIAGSLDCTLLFKEGRLERLETLRYTDDNHWHVKGTGAFHWTPDGGLQKLETSWFHLKEDVLKATYTTPPKGMPALNLYGKTLDLKNYLDTDLSSLLPTPKNPAAHKGAPLVIHLSAQKATFGHPIGLLNNVLKLTLDKGLIQDLTYQGSTEEALGTNRLVRAAITKKPNGLRKLTIQTEQGGEFLRALDIFGNIRGGNFKLVAFHDPAFQVEDWIGKIRVHNFALLKAPLVTRIFSLFPTGGTELTSDSGMTLTLLKMRFAASSKFFKIHACRAHGISVGFNLSGTIDRSPQGLLALQGSMIPLYIFNTLVSKIPLIGEAISGGKNQGIFTVAFGITGTKDHPDVTANPLSLMTPGLIRNFFPAGDKNTGKDDGWLDEEDRQGDIFDQEFQN